MKNKPTKRKVHKKHSLPPHTWQAHPVAKAGEVNKPLIISIITLVLIVGLVAFLFLVDTRQFAGQAIKVKTDVTPRYVGFFLDEATEVPGSNFTLPIQANIDNLKTVALYFELKMEGITCNEKMYTDSLGWQVGLVEDKVKCLDPSTLAVSYGTINPDDAKTGTFNIGTVTAVMPAKGNIKFTFPEFIIYPISSDKNMDNLKTSPAEVTPAAYKLGCNGPATVKDEEKQFVTMVSRDALAGKTEANVSTDYCSTDDKGVRTEPKGDYVVQYFCQNENISNYTIKKCDYGCDIGLCNPAPKGITGDTSKPVCGNAKKETGEQCDDGNTEVNDGCASCQIITGYTCKEDATGKSSCTKSASSEEGISIKLLDKDKKVTTSAKDEETVTIQITVTPTTSIPSHLLIGTVSYGNKQKLMIFDNKESLKKDETETMEFTHKVQNEDDFTVEALVWNQFPQATGKFQSLVKQKKVKYDVK